MSSRLFLQNQSVYYAELTAQGEVDEAIAALRLKNMTKRKSFNFSCRFCLKQYYIRSQKLMPEMRQKLARQVSAKQTSKFVIRSQVGMRNLCTAENSEAGLSTLFAIMTPRCYLIPSLLLQVNAAYDDRTPWRAPR